MPNAAPQPADLVHAMPDPALVVDAQGVVRLANEQAVELLEADPAGRHLSATLRAPDVLEAVTATASGAGSASVDYEIRVPVPRAFRAHVSCLGDGKGALITLRDLTREQQIERMRADFVANASHELRTPLTALSGFLETIQGPAKSDPKAQDKFLGLMKSQAERMRRLIDDLLSLSRIEMNEHVRPSGEVDLNQVSAHVRDVLLGLAREFECKLTLESDGPVVVTGSRDELVQVLQNLAENALKYGSTGKLVEIILRRNGEWAELSVRDHGPGIAEQHIPRLTERFYRVNVQDSRSRGGTGLGLAIVKHIINRHRGRLVITSELGKGSTFMMRLPVKAT
ncbi:MAG: PAS domain-containing protein [Aestuariivirga sp.]|uniref:ATP-binding protein n=1 Tax=Aestuariivirga sp. TaxID=2650926 RepID=UPI0025BA1E7F|nr:ATP-binding protein [Aestuariivirga sp.]MCA3559549.1 PAS domain-containing protein [Aestuariivirga sp.]